MSAQDILLAALIVGALFCAVAAIAAVVLSSKLSSQEDEHSTLDAARRTLGGRRDE